MHGADDDEISSTPPDAGDATLRPPSSVPPKIAPERLALRVSPKPVLRMSRRMIALALGASAVALAGAAIWSLSSHQRGPANQAELYAVDRIQPADGVARLPRDYRGVEPLPRDIPRLSPPLPGDLGKPMLDAGAVDVPSGDPLGGAGTAMRTGNGSAIAAAQAARQTRDVVRQSDVFFARGGRSGLGGSGGGGGDAMGNGGVRLGETGADDLGRIGALAAPGRGGAGNAGESDGASEGAASATTGGGDGSGQAGAAGGAASQAAKRAFLSALPDGRIYASAALQKPVSPYQLMAGSVMSAALITGIRSDLPGDVIAVVTAPVYDSVSGRHLLVPQGARLIGRYDSAVGYAQERLLLKWERLIFPDGRSILLDSLPGTDAGGRAGLTDRTDHHVDRLIGGAVLATLLGVGTSYGSSRAGVNADRSLVIATGDAAQGAVAQIGSEITRRNLDVQPTLTIRPGFPLKVIVERDLILEPLESVR